MKNFKQVILVVLDGFGVASAHEGNVVSQANIQNINYLVNHYPTTTLQASGPSVGLPWGERGNSEVGHLNLGAGRIVSEDLPRITKSIVSEDFFSNKAFLGAIEHVKKNDSALHLAGLLSNGGVHSSEEHLFALLDLAAEHKLKNVYIHIFTDGRDTPAKSALESLDRLSRKVIEKKVGKIATITGRFYSMDRAEHWGLTEKTYRAMVHGEGEKASSAAEAIERNYNQQIFDEIIPPTVILSNGEPLRTVENNDAVIFFNFRSDRARQLAKSFSDPDFSEFSSDRPFLKNVMYTTMTNYDDDLKVVVAFPPQKIKNSLSEIISKNKLSQFHIAESEKYAHVTSFFNGGRQDPWPGEEREIVSSPESFEKSYEDVPEMSAGKITKKVLEEISKGTNFILVNFANPDMVGHTGNKKAGILAVQEIDRVLGLIYEEVMKHEACLIITADHGNIEEVIEPRSGLMDKGHSSNPVPCIVIGKGMELSEIGTKGYAGLPSVVPEGVLSDVTPTILDLMGFSKPSEITAVSLIPALLKRGN